MPFRPSRDRKNELCSLFARAVRPAVNEWSTRTRWMERPGAARSLWHVRTVPIIEWSLRVPAADDMMLPMWSPVDHVTSVSTTQSPGPKTE